MSGSTTLKATWAWLNKFGVVKFKRRRTTTEEGGKKNVLSHTIQRGMEKERIESHNPKVIMRIWWGFTIGKKREEELHIK